MLHFFFKVDLIGTDEFAKRVVDSWCRKGVDVKLKIFPDSPHIKHMQKYPKEYLQLLHEHWDKVKLLERK